MAPAKRSLRVTPANSRMTTVPPKTAKTKREITNGKDKGKRRKSSASSFVRPLIVPDNQRDYFTDLPKEVVLLVLSFLEPRDLLRAGQTCSTLRLLGGDSYLWKDICRKDGILELPRSCVRSNYPWKATYLRQLYIEMNWRTLNMWSLPDLKGHGDNEITCLQLSGNKIVSGSDDYTLNVWSATTGKLLHTLTGHYGEVWCSQMSDKYIISGSADGTLRIWDVGYGNCIHTLDGHMSTVRCMRLHGGRVVSGSDDETLRISDVKTGKFLCVLLGHQAAISCVEYDGKFVVSGADDCKVKVWNPESQECLHTLQGHTKPIHALQFDGVHVVSSSLDTSIRVWDVESGQCRHTLMVGHQSIPSVMELRENYLISGNADSTVKGWNIITGECLLTLSGPNKHQFAVTCLQFNRWFVITSSVDGPVKLWDLKTGAFIRNLVTLGSGGSGGVIWKIRASETKLVCAVGSLNGCEKTRLIVLDFDI